MTYAAIRERAHDNHKSRQTMYRRDGGSVDHPDEAQDRALIKEMMDKKKRADGGAVQGRARGGKTDRPGAKGGKTVVNIVMPQSGGGDRPVPLPVPMRPPMGVAPGGMPPGAAPPPGAMPPRPMPPPGGVPGMGAMPPGGAPPMMPPRAKGGAVKHRDMGGMTGTAPMPGGATPMPNGQMTPQQMQQMAAMRQGQGAPPMQKRGGEVKRRAEGGRTGDAEERSALDRGRDLPYDARGKMTAGSMSGEGRLQKAAGRKGFIE